MGVLLMLMTVGGLAAAVILLAVGLLTKKGWLTKFTLGAAAVWLVFYGVMLLGFSLSSAEKNLAISEAKEYCGFYLDCHMHTVVTGVRSVGTIGDQTAEGEFYIVNVTVFSDAKNPSVGLHLREPKAVVIDANGAKFTRNEAAESSLPTADVDLGQTIWNSSPIEKEIVFDLPVGVRGPRLDISEGWGIERYIEAALVDDEDSIFHARTFFKLQEQNIALGVK